jgi:hypothetical protein
MTVGSIGKGRSEYMRFTKLNLKETIEDSKCDNQKPYIAVRQTIYSKICIKRSHLTQRKSGLIRQVTS